MITKIEEIQAQIKKARELIADSQKFLSTIEPKDDTFEKLFHTTCTKNLLEAGNHLLWVEEDLPKLRKLREIRQS
jgi:hypothetical protein